MFSRPAQRLLHAFSRKPSVNAVPPNREAEPQSASRAAASGSSSTSGAVTPASDANDSKLAPFLSGFAPESPPEDGGGLQFYLDDELAQCTGAETTPKAMFARAVHVPWSAPGTAHAGPGAQLERTVRRLLTELALSQTPQGAAADGSSTATGTAAAPPPSAPAPPASHDLGALSERLRQAGLRVVVTSPARPDQRSPLTTRSISSPFLLVIRQAGDDAAGGVGGGSGSSDGAVPSFASHSDGEALGAAAAAATTTRAHLHPHLPSRHHPAHARLHHTATGLAAPNDLNDQQQHLRDKLHCGGGGGGGSATASGMGGGGGGEVEVVVVDVALREHLAVAPSTPAYERTLAASVPEMFIGSLSRLSELVRSMASAIALNFSSQGVCVPPWRRTQALLSRWSVAEDIERQLRLQQRRGGGGGGRAGGGALGAGAIDVEALAAASAVAATGMSRQHLGHGGGAAPLAAPPADAQARQQQPPLLHPLLQPLFEAEAAAAAAAAAANAGVGGVHRPAPLAPDGLPWTPAPAWQQQVHSQLRLQAPQRAERRHELDAAMAQATAAAAAGAAGVSEALPEGQVHGGFSAAGRQAANRPAMVVLGFVVPSAVEREEQATAAVAGGRLSSSGGRQAQPRARDAWGAEMRPAGAGAASGGLAGVYGRAGSVAASGNGSSTSTSSTSGSTDSEEASGARSPTSVLRNHLPAAAAAGAGAAAGSAAGGKAAKPAAAETNAAVFGTLSAYSVMA